MIAKDLMTNQLAPLHPEDNGEQAMTMMHIYHVKHLPIVSDDEDVLGMVSEDDIAILGMDKKISSLDGNKRFQFVQENDHLFEVLAKIAEEKYTTVAVVDQNNKYIGMIEQEALLQYYADSFSFKEPGSIIVLEMEDHQYSLAEIARLVEGEKGVILSSFLSKIKGAEKSLVTLKVNRKDISGIMATLERFDYKVKSSFSEDEYMGNLKERYDSLMKYLDV